MSSKTEHGSVIKTKRMNSTMTIDQNANTRGWITIIENDNILTS